MALSLEAAVAVAEVDKKANENEKDEAASRIIGNINEIFEWNNASPSAAHFFMNENKLQKFLQHLEWERERNRGRERETGQEEE